jgi:hypothetical protein
MNDNQTGPKKSREKFINAQDIGDMIVVMRITCFTIIALK